MSNKKSDWIPEIMYEDSLDGVTQSLPFILVPEGKTMPAFLLLWEHRNTGEFEPGPKGEEIPIVDSELRQYAAMHILAEKLSSEDYDKVRLALGLEKKSVAARKGAEITAKAVLNAQNKASA